MGGFRLKEGEAERIEKMRAAGLGVSEISRRLERSYGFVRRMMDRIPDRAVVAPSASGLSPDRRALADMILGMDMSKDQELKVLEAIL